MQAPPAKSTSSGILFGDVCNGDSSPQTSTGTLCSLEEEEEDQTINEDARDAWSFNSQLSKTLPQILADKGALGYFIQFMETRNCLAVIKFWLEVECLCSSFDIVEPKKDNIEDSNCTDNSSRLPNSMADNENFRCEVTQNNTNDCDIENASFSEVVNSSSMESNCNDMPKTSHARSRMRQSSNCKGGDMTTIRQDALRIYKKYIAKDALGVNQIPEDLKAEIEHALMRENTEPMLQCLSVVQKIVYKTLENE